MSTPTEAPAAASNDSGDDAADDASAAAIMAEVAAEFEGKDDAAAADGAAAPAAEAKPDAKADDKPADKPAAEPEGESLRKAGAALAKERQRLREREARAKAVEEKAAALDKLAEAAKADPLAVLSRLGVGVDDVLQRVINDGKAAPETADQRVERLERELAARDERAKQAETQRMVSEWRDGLVRTVQAAGEKYDLVNSLGLHDLVVETAAAYARQYGELLDADTAAAQVEKHFASALGKSKKFGPREAVKDAPKSQDTPPKPQRKGPTTLGSVPQSDLPPSDDGLPEDPHARMKAVMRALEIS